MNCARCVIEHLGVDLLPAEPGSLVFTDDLIEEHAGKGSPRSDRSTPA
jgi:hypothetical protein